MAGRVRRTGTSKSRPKPKTPRAKAKPKTCYGPADGQHQHGCRKDRPLCRWRRRAYAVKAYGAGGPCHCSAYAFPHRPGSGDCSRAGGSGAPGGGEGEREYRERLEMAAAREARDARLAASRRAPSKVVYTNRWPVRKKRAAKTLCPTCRRKHRDHSLCSRRAG